MKLKVPHDLRRAGLKRAGITRGSFDETGVASDVGRRGSSEPGGPDAGFRSGPA